MFVQAYQKVIKFTKPIIISQRTRKKECYASIGAFVLINNEGWAFTASHIVRLLKEIQEKVNLFNETEIKKKEIYEAGLDKKEKSNKLKKLPNFEDNSPINVSTWWSQNNVSVDKVIINPNIDIALLKFENFDFTGIDNYPLFKNPDNNFSPGKSLCRVGFPFSDIKPTFEEDTNSFILPQNSIPIPFFPNEGIFTRNVLLNNDSSINNRYKLMYIETSSPGLRGQSGGPIFDTDGNIWGIQSSTQHYPLGFSPRVPNSKKNEVEHQFMNIGWGVHVETLIGMMIDNNINFNISQE